VDAWRVLGLISGTSMDGIDVAVADLRVVRERVELHPVRHGCVDYPAQLRAMLLAALPPGECGAETLCALDTGIGQSFADVAVNAIRELPGRRVDLVSSLGQTLYHWVAGGRCLGTLQLGQPAWIAEATGVPVVSDLRARDVAAGGHGAPLAPTLDELWLRGLGTGTAAALNIGGIANITMVPKQGPAIGYDTGPGNALLDLAWRSRLATSVTRGTRYDTNGEIAKGGKVRSDLLDALLADPYYAAEPPKSTGKEHFHAGYLDHVLAGLSEVAGADLLATLTELTAVTVAQACQRHGVRQVVVSGGGAANRFLMDRLAAHLSPIPLATSDDWGLPADGKEAYLAALLGFLTFHGLGANNPGATGADGPRLLGSITPGSGPLRLPEPVDHRITQLTVTGRDTPAAGGSSARH
jgi:anhydro-N-acetylmuramic acid kinase